MGPLAALISRWSRDREGLAAALFAVAVAVVVVAWPLSQVTYPPLTDLPMHASQTSVFRHFWDASYRFRDQFELHPVATPYVSTYALGAIAMLFFSASVAVRIATGIALLMLPAGVAVLAWGMRKSPLIGLGAAPVAWCHLVHWGFINFVCAIGLDAMAIGLALRLVDAPSKRLRVALAIALVAVFFTHIFRFPYAIAGVTGAGVFAAWAKTEAPGLAARLRDVARRASSVVPSMLPALCLFAWFWTHRLPSLAPTSDDVPLTLDLGRVDLVVPYLVGGFRDPGELQGARIALGMLVGVAAATLVARFRNPAATPARDASDRRFRRVAIAAVACNVAALVAGYFLLPMQIGNWWYVYPREATGALVLSLALLPDLPRVRGARAVAVVAMAIGALAFARVPARQFALFERDSADFRRIIAAIPKAPRLMYVIYDHGGTTRLVSPWVHLPAWVQADRGGWLSFHFALFGASPIRYRTDGDAIVPPAAPIRWEWEPETFDPRKQAYGYDWFLIRSRTSPAQLFAADPEIVPVAHDGTWWLYRREAGATTDRSLPGER